MTKIEEYHEKKEIAIRMRRWAELVNNRDCDKFGAVVTISSHHAGFYGDRNVGSWPDFVVRLIAREASKRLKQLALWAADSAEKDAEIARKAAREEAEEIINGTEPD